ncbi:hypothetical protein [Pantoea sp. PGP6]
MIELIVFRPNQFHYKTLLDIPGEEAMHHGLIFEGRNFSVNYVEYQAPMRGGIKRIWYAVEEGLAVAEEQVIAAERNLGAD